MPSAGLLDAFDRAIGEVIGRLVTITLFDIVDPEISDGLMPAAGELMMLSRLLIEAGVEHAVQIIRDNSCSLVLRPRGSTELQRCRIMNKPGIL